MDKNLRENNYWIGPYGIFIRHNMFSVVAEDGYNIIYKDGFKTDFENVKRVRMNDDLYKKTYAIFDEITGNWYYKW
ncbi:hypothetical protein [Acanthamoeba castellanii mimivirus]|jgi:hypothetical protein|uniref:Uncharacterized protein n=3 Tax=Mimivirus TaxID=315393 RepID=A0A0G2YCG6_MIMIV|nr:hypothetical protein [Acanthamoeba polyphaga mimivirus]AMK61771.1 hypothetical protein [Samba virus]BAV61204.1 hypothetical protein [Acanthamoeba castellanii mimivirus]BAV62192.1 hypothetical protein [Acanthamoeba castellanii mimivirus]